MAITRDYIYQSDYTANAQALADWLTANAADYFDSVTVSDGTVTCSAGDTVLLEITLTATNCTARAITAAGLSYFAGTSGSAAYRVHYAWKTAHGIAISVASSAGNGLIPALWVTKDTAGNTAIAAWTKFFAPTNQSSGTALMIAGASAASTSSQSFVLPATSARTVLSPLLMSDNDATDLPYLFYTPYSQYSDPGTLTVDGTEYLYSGCIALCDGEPGSGSADLTNYYTRAQTDAAISACQPRTELLYNGSDGLKEIEGDFSKYSYLKVALGSDNSYWSYHDINKGLTAVPIVRVSGGNYYLGRINFTSSNSKISISDFLGFIMAESGLTPTTDLNLTLRRVYGVY